MAGWNDNSGFQYDDFERVYDAIESTPDQFKIPTDVQREKIYFYTTNNKVIYSPKQLYRQYKNSIVTIIVMNEVGEFSQATGFVIADNGVIATNEHVIFGSDFDNPDKNLVQNIGVVFYGDKKIIMLIRTKKRDEIIDCLGKNSYFIEPNNKKLKKRK